MLIEESHDYENNQDRLTKSLICDLLITFYM